MQDNQVYIRGTVKRDAEGVATPSGGKMMNFCLAIPDAFNRKTMVYVDCVAMAEIVDEIEGFLTEGEEVTVGGSLTFRTVTKENGKKKTGLSVYVESIDIKEEK